MNSDDVLIRRPPMISDIDIWRSAATLVRQHGAQAPSMAARRCNELIDCGDIDGQQVWFRILRATKKLQQATPAIRLPLH